MIVRNHKFAVAMISAMAVALPALAQGMPKAASEKPSAPAAESCDDMQVSLYFQAYDTSLTPQAATVIDAASEKLEACIVKSVSVNVLSEEAHTDEEAAALSEARANTVIAALSEHGVEPIAYETDLSRVEASAPAARVAEPMARRVSVSFDVQPRYGSRSS